MSKRTLIRDARLRRAPRVEVKSRAGTEGKGSLILRSERSERLLGWAMGKVLETTLRDARLRRAPRVEVKSRAGTEGKGSLILRSERSERLEGWATVEVKSRVGSGR